MRWAQPIEMSDPLLKLVQRAWLRAVGRYLRGKKLSGYDAGAIERRSRKADVPFPKELSQFLEVVDERLWQRATQGASRLRWFPLEDLGGRGIARLQDTIAIGCFDGDFMLHLATRPNRDGRRPVMAVDAQSRQVVLGDTLSQWLSRFITCGFREPSIHHDNFADLNTDLRPDYLSDHLRLNPTDEWARARMAEDQVAEAQGLLPLGTKRVERKYDSDPLEFARSEREVEDLMLSNCSYSDLSAIKQLKSIRCLYLYQGKCKFDVNRRKHVVDCGVPVDTRSFARASGV